MQNFIANDISRAMLLRELIYGTNIERFSYKHNLIESEIQSYISNESTLTRTIAITLAVKIGLPVFYFENTIPDAYQRDKPLKSVAANQHKPDELKRLAVFKELVGRTSVYQFAEDHGVSVVFVQKYLSGAIKIDKTAGRKLALKLGLKLNYFDVTQALSSCL